MNSSKLRIEHALYALVLLAALALRWGGLGSAPLTESEASLALQAWDLANNTTLSDPAVAPGSQVAYTHLSAVFFALLGASNWLARFWPALLGGLFILAPILWRETIGRKTAFGLAVALASSPLLVAASRSAGGPLPAALFTALAIGFWYRRQPIWAGLCAGLGLLSGPAVWHGLIGISLAIAAGGWIFKEKPPGWFARPGSASFLVAILAILLAVGALFGLHWQGLGIWLGSISLYLQGWVNPSGIPALRLLAALVVYEPLALIFGLIGLAIGWRRGERLAQIAGLWLVAALMLVVLYPGRQVFDLVWVLLPLWLLAVDQIVKLLTEKVETVWIAGVQAAVLLLLAALLWLNLVGLGMAIANTDKFLLHIGVIASAIGLGVVTSVFVGYGWSWPTARKGLGWGLTVTLGLYSLANLGGVYLMQTPGRFELWQPLPVSGQADLLSATVAELSDWNTGRTEAIDITLAVQSAALRWTLRDYAHLNLALEEQQVVLLERPSIVITRQTQQSPALADAYRGQDFVWWSYPAWTGALPPGFAGWLAFRQAPLQEEQILLWARADLFPANPPTVSEATSPLPAGGPSEQ